MTRKILLQLDTDPQPSVFDAITALDSADCVLLRHGGVTPENVVSLVHGCMFTRSPRELSNTAIFIGGSDMEASGKIFAKVRETMWPPLDVSVMFDPNGCNTTAASAVFNLASGCEIAGKKVAVISGTGPVGQRAAGILIKKGASVVITSRDIEKAEAAAKAIALRFGEKPDRAVMRNENDLPSILDGAAAALCCGAAGVCLLPERIWKGHKTLKAIADVNAVPPLGAEGTETAWCGQESEGKKIYGAIGIGWLKMRVHHLAISKLFEAKGVVFDTERIFDLAKEATESASK
jgi:hypothetical protein